MTSRETGSGRSRLALTTRALPPYSRQMHSVAVPPPYPPRYLYKYLGTENYHFGVLERLEIRFSQPSVLNDPFDCFPIIVPPNDVHATVERQIERNLPAWEATNNMRLSAERLDIVRGNLREGYIGGQFVEKCVEILRNHLEQVGVLSLADSPDNLIMWAHYGANHTGFVIEFDTRYAPLIQRADEEGDQGRPVPVRYSDGRPQVPCDPESLVLPDDLLVQKLTVWEPEREWRVIRDRALADRQTTTDDGQDLSLFNIDPLAIAAVRIGIRANDVTVNRIRSIVTTDSRLSHVRLFRGNLGAGGQFRWRDA